jgi:hypothetical protein
MGSVDIPARASAQPIAPRKISGLTACLVRVPADQSGNSFTLTATVSTYARIASVLYNVWLGFREAVRDLCPVKLKNSN